jgi:hypothetical protein
MKGSSAAAYAGVPVNERITPHPVPLPQGEGTVLLAQSVIQAFPLPGGEGQGEGRSTQFIARPGILRPAIAIPAPKPRRWDLA